MNAKTVSHTLGPWKRNIKPATKFPIVYAGRNTHVAQVSSMGLDPETVEANLCLIMAAPDLYAGNFAALDVLRALAAERNPNLIEAVLANLRGPCSIIPQLESALAKAEGKP
jgi:hypothetical protein